MNGVNALYSTLLSVLVLCTGCTLREIAPSEGMTAEEAKRIISSYQAWKSDGTWKGEVTDDYFDDYYWIWGGALVSPFPSVLYVPGGAIVVSPQITGSAPDRTGETRLRYTELGQLRKYYSARNLLTPLCLFIIGPIAYGFEDRNQKVDVWHPNWKWFLPMWLVSGWGEDERLVHYAEALEFMRRRTVVPVPTSRLDAEASANRRRER